MKKLWNLGFNLYKKYEEGINYLFWGFASFVLNMILFYLLANVCHIQELITNIISWIACVIFAYFTNRMFVFKSQNKDMQSAGTEFIQFISARIGTLILEEVVIFIGITLLHGNNMIVKLIGQVLVIVSNYILSKIWIFKKKS